MTSLGAKDPENFLTAGFGVKVATERSVRTRLMDDTLPIMKTMPFT